MSEHALNSSGTTRLSALRRGLSRDSAAGALLAIVIGFLVAQCRPLPPGPSFCWPSLPRSWHSLWATCAGSCLRVVLLDIPLHWDVNLGWRPEAAAVGAVGGIGISATTLALCGLYALWIAERTAGRTHPLRLWPALPLVAYVGVTALSLIVAEDRQLGLFELVLLLQTLLLSLRSQRGSDSGGCRFHRRGPAGRLPPGEYGHDRPKRPGYQLRVDGPFE